MMMSEWQLGQSDLRFTMPLIAGQKVVVLGRAFALAESLASAGFKALLFSPAKDRDMTAYGHCIASEREQLPVGQFSVDHVLVPEFTLDMAGWIPGEVVRILKPGGTLGLGFFNRSSLAGWRSSRNPQGIEFRPLAGATIDQWLSKNGLRLKASYGIWANLKQPRYLVPLHQKATIVFFFSQLFTPYSWKAALVQPMVSLTARLGWGQTLFPHLYVVAQAI
jgi:hypothetical protein